MHQIINLIKSYKITLSWLVVMVIAGMLGGFIAASVVCLPLLFLGNTNVKIETLLVLFIVTYLLGDNFSGTFSFAQNLRFVILGIGLLVLLRLQLFKSNLGYYILPFSIVATLITFSLSPVGLEATARGLSYFLVAMVVFKCVQLLVEFNAGRFFDLLVILLSIYFALNFVLYFIPIIEVTFIKGRYGGLMANPNGLGMAAMFSYGVIDVINRKSNSSFSSRFFTFFKVLLMVLIILSASRTALFSILIFELCIRLLKHKLLLMLTLILMVYIYGISATLSLQAFAESFGLSSYLRLDTIEDASGRTDVWVVAIEEIKRQPWLGKGILYDNYFINYYGNRFLGENRARHWYGIWNSYLSLLLNVGIVGVMVFSFFWYKMFALSQMKIVRFAFLLMCLFSAISESWMAASMNAFMPLVFLCWGLQINQTKSISV